MLPAGLTMCRPLALLLVAVALDAHAECRQEPVISPSTYAVHLGPQCTEQEREGLAVDAASLEAALRQGKGVDLSGVIVRGDLDLDALPLRDVQAAEVLTSDQIETLKDPAVQTIRVVGGPFIIKNSIVRGAIRHQSKHDRLAVAGPVDLSGTTFERIVDLSRSVFLEPVTLSGAVFLREAYFVQGRFESGVTAEKTAFGPHTRFHRSVFHGPARFTQSGFNGMAEFLEVTFDREAELPRTYFKQGTGFSGATFRQSADFSEAVFEGQAFFTFASFEADVFFRRATFKSHADFSDAVFRGVDDFDKAFFQEAPTVVRTARSNKTPMGLQNPTVQYVITASLLMFTALLLVYLVRAK